MKWIKYNIKKNYILNKKIENYIYRNTLLYRNWNYSENIAMYLRNFNKLKHLISHFFTILFLWFSKFWFIYFLRDLYFWWSEKYQLFVNRAIYTPCLALLGGRYKLHFSHGIYRWEMGGVIELFRNRGIHFHWHRLFFTTFYNLLLIL